MSEANKRNLKGKFGPTTLNEAGEYDRITSNGPFTAHEPFTAEMIKVNGPSTVEQDATITVGKVNGPAIFQANLNVKQTFKVNGPLSVNGDLIIEEAVKVNGPLKSTGEIHGTNKESSKLRVNGPIKTINITGLEYLGVHGIVESENVESEKVRVNGVVQVQSIKSKEVLIQLGKKESNIDSIEADYVEIGTDLEDEFFLKSSKFFGRLVKKIANQSPGYAVIKEIRSNGVVEIDHVKVEKVFAKELYVGEDTEVGEFIELKDSSSTD